MLSPRSMLVVRRLPIHMASVMLFGLISTALWGQEPPPAPGFRVRKSIPSFIVLARPQSRW